jgi:hypothetical protein
MIKLTDLIDEIDLRTGPLDIPEEDTANFFLDEFGFPEDVFDTEEEWEKPIEEVVPNFFKQVNKKKKVVAKAEPFELIVPSSYFGHLYLVNTDAETNDSINNLNGYLAGFIDVAIINTSATNGISKPFKMTGAEIHLTHINKGYRGMGLGTIMYQMLLQAYKTIFSDSILYEASRAVWIKKLAPMANGRNIIFGGQIGNTIVPLSLEDASNDDVMGEWGFDRYFLTTNPPAELRKIAGAVQGLSITNQEYGIYQPKNKMTAQQLIDIADTVDSIPALIKAAKLDQTVGYAGVADQFKKILVETNNAIVVVDDIADAEVI